MVEILPPPKPAMLVVPPDMRISVAPSPHILFLEDYEYYDSLGRDPLQQNLVWSIKDAGERVEKLKQVLEQHPVAKQYQRRKILLKAVRRGDMAIVRYLVSTGLKVQPDIENLREEEKNKANNEAEEDTESIPDKDDPSVAPFHLSASCNNLEILKLFMEGAPNVAVDTRDELGQTALIRAATGGADMDIMRYLLGQGADPLARCDAEGDLAKQYLGEYAGADALELAAKCGNVEGVRLLLEQPGVSVTPLAIKGAASSSFDMLRLLLERGDYPMVDAEGETKAELLNEEQRQAIIGATPNAASTGDLDSLKLLFSYQYPMDDNDKPTFPAGFPEELYKPFIWGAYGAIARNNVDRFQYLASFDLKEHETMSLDDVPEGQPLNVQHLLDKAAEAGAIDSLNFLIQKYGATPNLRRVPSGCAPLFYAAANNKTDMVQELLENHQADIHFGNGRYVTGPTALFIAISLKSFDSIGLLLQRGGPVDHVDDEIRNIDKPMTAVLRAEFKSRAPVRLEIEDNVDSQAEWRGGWQSFNPLDVVLHLVPSDKSWISGLQARKSDEELRDMEVKAYGEKMRELNSENAKKSEDLGEKYVNLMQAWPTLEHRQDELQGDDDLCPAWEPAFVPARKRSLLSLLPIVASTTDGYVAVAIVRSRP